MVEHERQNRERRRAADARAAVHEALRIEPSLPEAHALRGVWAGGYDNYDWHEAEQHWRVAMSAELVSCHVHFWYGHHYLLPLGRCIVPDLVGMGDSAKLPGSGAGSYTFVEHRRYLDGVLRSLGVELRGQALDGLVLLRRGAREDLEIGLLTAQALVGRAQLVLGLAGAHRGRLTRREPALRASCRTACSPRGRVPPRL